MANTSLPNLTERTATANTDLIHVNSGGTDYKETKANFLSDVNSSISALNNSLTKYYDTGAYPDITIGSNHEASFDKPSAVVGKQIVAINILSWSSATGAFFIAGMYDAQTKFFVGGDAGVVIKGLNLRVWYKD